MKIFCIADIHGGHIDFTGAGQCDCIFLLGDMGGSYAWQVKDFLYDNPGFRSRIFSILGNHDDDSDVEHYPWLNFQKYGQAQTITCVRKQYSVLFLPFCETYKRIIIKQHPDIIVSHQPPVTYSGMTGFHRGIPLFAEMQKNASGSLWIHGHIHVNESMCGEHVQSVYGSRIILF